MNPWPLFRRTLVSGAVLGFTVATVSGAANTNFFPIMAWNWAPNDPAVLKRMAEGGITVAGFVAPDALDACHAAGLKAIVSDNRSSNYDWAGTIDLTAASNNIASLVKEVGQHPALLGYYLRDEPHAGMFPGLAVVAGLVQKLSPGKWPYINLFPDYARPISEQQLAIIEDFQQWLKENALRPPAELDLFGS